MSKDVENKEQNIQSQEDYKIYHQYENIYEMFITQAKKYPKRKYIQFEDKVYTYSESRTIINQMASFMKSKGVKQGDKVVLLLGNSPEFVFSVFATLAVGAILIPMNVFFKGHEASYIIQDSETSFIISNKEFSSIIEEVRVATSNVKQIFSFDDEIFGALNFYNHINNFSPDNVICNAKFNDTALYIYTSGTTGHPKGAMLSHSNILESIISYSIALKADHKDKILIILPMFHTYTFSTCIMWPTSYGASMIILKSVMDMKKDRFKKILIYKRPTIMLGVPQVYSALAKSPMPKWFIKLLYPIRIHISGGAPLPEEIFNQFKKKFGRAVIEGYGLSEASPVVAFNPQDKQKQGTVGLPLDRVQVKIVDNEEKEVPVGEIGELIVKGPNIMQGYYHMPKATDDAIRNGWLFTGDFAKIDEDGYLTIVDRKKDLIIAKGMNVYPREVEEVIYTFPGVDAAAVIGIPSQDLGEMIVAYIQPKENEEIDEKALRNFLSKNLANFKIPRQIKIINNIPLTATGKVLKKELKKLVSEGKI